MFYKISVTDCDSLTIILLSLEITINNKNQDHLPEFPKCYPLKERSSAPCLCSSLTYFNQKNILHDSQLEK